MLIAGFQKSKSLAHFSPAGKYGVRSVYPKSSRATIKSKSHLNPHPALIAISSRNVLNRNVPLGLDSSSLNSQIFPASMNNAPFKSPATSNLYSRFPSKRISPVRSLYPSGGTSLPGPTDLAKKERKLLVPPT